jgi:hypothetical protein
VSNVFPESCSWLSGIHGDETGEAGEDLEVPVMLYFAVEKIRRKYVPSSLGLSVDVTMTYLPLSNITRLLTARQPCQ